MKLRIEATTQDEVQAKGHELLEKLAKALRPHAPAVAEALDAATSSLDDEVEPLRSQALAEQFAREQHEYAVMLDRMIADIAKVLAKHVGSA